MKEKKRIAVVATSAAIGNEKGLNRMFYLAEMLADNGYNVDFITSDFQHWTKSFRNMKDVKSLHSKCKIVLLHEIGYKKNVEIRRMYSHYVLARQIRHYLNQNEYDLVYSDLPDNHVAVVAAEYAKKKSVPFICDIEDLWPKAMRMVFDVPIISDVLFSYFSRDAKKVYRLSSGVIGSSDTYRDEPLNYNIRIENRQTVYVGIDLANFDKEIKDNISFVRKPEDEFWVTYAGSLGTSYDIPTLIRAADILKKRNYRNIKVMLLGDGPMRKEWEELAARLDGNVQFCGYQQHALMAAYLKKSDILVNSLRKNAPQSIVSKIGDYLGAGKPMINTCMDSEFWKKVENDGFGYNVEPENADALADVIIKMASNELECQRMGHIARTIAEEQFDRSKSFLKIVHMVDELI